MCSAFFNKRVRNSIAYWPLTGSGKVKKERATSRLFVIKWPIAVGGVLRTKTNPSKNRSMDQCQVHLTCLNMIEMYVTVSGNR